MTTPNTNTELSPGAQRVVTVCDANTTWYCELQDTYTTDGDVDWVKETLNEDPDDGPEVGYRDTLAAMAYLAERDGWDAPEED